MGEKEIIEINKNGWNELVRSGKNYSNTSLPEYGPFMRNEEYFNIFKDVKNKKVLELGCAKGESLKYLQTKGASEVWGIDISEEQIKYAKIMCQLENFLFQQWKITLVFQRIILIIVYLYIV